MFHPSYTFIFGQENKPRQFSRLAHSMSPWRDSMTPRERFVSHQTGKGKSSTQKSRLVGDILVLRRVCILCCDNMCVCVYIYIYIQFYLFIYLFSFIFIINFFNAKYIEAYRKPIISKRNLCPMPSNNTNYIPSLLIATETSEMEEVSFSPQLPEPLSFLLIKQ